MYKVITSGRKREFESREEAIRAAKRLSRRMHDNVKVLRGNGSERMMYRNGRLEEGVYITPDRRGRAPRLG